MKKQGKYLRQKPKKQKAQGAFRFVCTLLATVVCLTVTLPVMAQMLLYVGANQIQKYEKQDNVQILQQLDTMLDTNIGRFFEGITNPNSNIESDIPPVKKVYWLNDEDLVAPEPDQAKFGEADSPAELQWLLDEAAEILDGQEMYFSTETQLMPGTTVRYYMDETIVALAWKELHNYGVYSMSEVKVAHPSQFRRFLAGGEYGSEKQFITTEMAASVNAVVASSGDFYRFRNEGIVVYEGQVRRIKGNSVDTCMIDDQGDLHFVRKGEILDIEVAQQYVDEHNIRFSLAFGPILVDDGEIYHTSTYPIGEINNHYSRAGLGQLGDLHYLLVAVNTENQYRTVPTMAEFAAVLHGMGCVKAYALDGGQTAVVVMNDELVNRPDYGYQRQISDIIYFATAIPDGD